MNNIALAAFLVAILSATQGLSFLLLNRSNRQFRAFAGFCFAIFFTNMAVALESYELLPHRFLGQVRMIGGIACAVTATLFFSRLLRYRNWAFRFRPGSSVTAIILGVMVLVWYQPNDPLKEPQLAQVFRWLQQSLETGSFIGRPPAKLLWEPLLNHLTIWAVAIYMFGTFFALSQGVRRLRGLTRSPSERARLTLLTWLGTATTVACALQSLLWYLYPDHLRFPLGGLAQLVFVYFLSQVLLQYRLLDMWETTSKLIIYVSLVVVVALCYALVFAGFGNMSDPSSLLVTLLLASGIVLTLYDPLKRWVERMAQRAFFRRRYELRSELDNLEREIPSAISLDLLLDRLLSVLTGTPNITRVVIYLWNEKQLAYRLERRFGPEGWAPREMVPSGGPFVEGLQHGRVYVVEDLERELQPEERPGDNPNPREMAPRLMLKLMSELQVQVMVPIVGTDVLLGFIGLAAEVSDEGYTHDEVELLAELADRAATGVLQSESLARLTERERLAALGAMAAGLAHEIRNPLGAIKGAAQYLGGMTLEPDAREFLDIIVAESNRLNDVVSEFLDYARPLRIHRSPVDLPLELRQIVRIFEAGGLPPGVHINLEVEEGVDTVLGDEAKLRQVFLNLGRNALQAMPKGGVLTITAQRGLSGGRRGDPVVRVIFADTGTGISPDHLKKLFIPFFTTRREGSGLGLAISQRLVEAHEGSLRVESQPGDGTRFTVELPSGEVEGKWSSPM